MIGYSLLDSGRPTGTDSSGVNYVYSFQRNNNIGAFSSLISISIEKTILHITMMSIILSIKFN